MSRRVRFHAKPNVGSVKTNAAIVNKPNKKSLKDDLSTQNETEKKLLSSKISEKQLIQSQPNNPLTPIELTRTSEKTNSEKADESSKNLKVPSDQPSTSEETTNQLISRRPRFVAKPNLGAFKSSFKPPPLIQRYSSSKEATAEATTSFHTEDNSRQESAATSLLQLSMSWPSELPPPPSYMMPFPLPATPKRIEPDDPLSRIRSPSPKKYATLSNVRVPTPGSPIKFPGSPGKRQRTISGQSIMSKVKKLRKPSTEELDAKTFTLSDLISWKPNVENDLKKKIKDKRKQLEQNDNNPDTPQSAPTEKTENINGPRVKVDEAGNIVIDEESLIMSQIPETSSLQTIDDDLIAKKLNSWSFRKWKRTSTWSKLETDLFYEVLGACGPDFGLMHEYIPTRTRAEIKKKFNKEEKTDRKRIDERLKNPAILDDVEIRRITQHYYHLIEEEENQKNELKKEKEARKAENRNRRSTVNSDIISGVSSLVQAHQIQYS
uniref:SANT domain-containing protein n=1 Tax=Acrobeloides nanus TaxID=290746 RepID=A0A914CAN5_9BILA